MERREEGRERGRGLTCKEPKVMGGREQGKERRGREKGGKGWMGGKGRGKEWEGKEREVREDGT